MWNMLRRVLRWWFPNKHHRALTWTSFLLHYVTLRWLRYFIKRQASDRRFVAINLIEHFGDIVACEPVSRYVRQKHPGAYIVWSVRKPYRELIDNNPHVDKTLVVHCLTEWIHLAKSGVFDEIIDLHIQGRVCRTCRIPLKKSKGNMEITLENYFDFGSILSAFGQSAGLPALDEQPKVYIPQSVIRRVDICHLPDRFIVIHCSSNEACKDWLPSKWQDLAERTIDNWQLSVVEVGLVPALNNITSPKYIDLCGKLSILETAEVIRRSRLFIGVDSGPAQLANAVGTFGIVLLGHYRAFRRYMPYSGNYTNGSKAELIHEDGQVANITVERVYQAVEKRRQVVNSSVGD